ncbi:hypothetical protein DBR23_03665 [Acidovorax sp. HMWF018]|uniref:Arc family DNA-binding protein n=1 Tax=Acidovorax sp. HMWF018 TaxID=2056855 RepID=UPI000D33BC1C|nr:Arc family DNA-binding protein [Acidovorax sp. HMWF018]PTT42364.1 hypothetical protein DBR23_03665 [Acidovorax sp. HMWF018]
MATETSSTGRESDKFMLRFPEGMRAVIKEAAEKNGRTMNAEIISRLQASFDKGKDRPISNYATVDHGDDPPPLDIYAQLAIHAERRALAVESEKLQLLQDELWTVNSWRETMYGKNCAHHLDELAAGLAETIGELSELDEEIESARADADQAANKVPDLPGPWQRRTKP